MFFHEHLDAMPGGPNHSDLIPALNASIADYRQGLSDRTAVKLLPALIYLSIVLLVGFVGNGLVFHVYLTRIPASATRPTILALACFDLTTCLISIPGEMLDIRFSFNFPSDALCKLSRLSTTFLLIASGFTLLLVALDRYNRICHPMRNQVTIGSAWMRVAGACLVAFFLSILAPLVNAKTSIETPIAGVTGQECSTDPHYKTVAFVYYIILGVVFLSAFVVMILMYVFIGRRVLRQSQFRIAAQRKRPSRKRGAAADDDEEDPSSSCSKECGSSQKFPGEFSHSGNASDGYHSSSSKSNKTPQEDDIEEEQRAKSGQDMTNAARNLHPPRAPPGLPRKSSSFSRRTSVFTKLRSNSLDAGTRRTTLMLFLLTMVFVVSFLPHLVISVLQVATKSLHAHDVNGTVNVLYNIFVRSFFLNTVANPFIYGFCSPTFRRECGKLIAELAFWRTKGK